MHVTVRSVSYGLSFAHDDNTCDISYMADAIQFPETVELPYCLDSSWL